MRKPRDFDSELKAISARAKVLQESKLRQLGELVVATGADTLPIEQLAGALIASAKAESAAKEVWRKAGTAFFHGSRRRPSGAAAASAGGGQSSGGGAPSPTRQEDA
jgi:hypothetical protein